ncbi:unnamed protein product [Owenia fusiformis]|uniref:Uncharacterized protein n=1 Tax=Owenia fusiformis TaxID=6347 RepID=A0A8J1YBZ9_OWEFU|nr:unnamed protein product [Owenia fusiformis]
MTDKGFLHSTPKVHGRLQSSRSPTSARRSLSPAMSAQRISPNRLSTSKTYRQSNPMSELENNTIQKQRKELQLLIQELKERDNELNEMVSTHHKQLLAWEDDRQKVLTLEQRNARLQGELGARNEEVKNLSAQLKTCQSEELNKSTALESTQQQLAKLTEQASCSNMQLQDMEDVNRNLNTSVQDMSSTIGQLEAREQELLTMLRLKDKDLIEASNHIAELSVKLKRLDGSYRESQQSDRQAKRDITDWKQRHSEARQEIQRLNNELSNEQSSHQEQSIESERLKQIVGDLQRQLDLAGEREKRKDELVALQRSKQERTDMELTSLRQLYERQQREISLLQLNLDSSKDLIATHTSFNSPQSSPVRPRSSQSRHSSPTRSPLKSLANAGDASSGLPNGSLPNTGFSNGMGTSDFMLLTDQNNSQGDVSPTSKLHRLLTESRQMVESLEKTTLPPYIPQEKSEAS